MMQNYELMLLLNPNAMDEVDDFLMGLEDIIKGDKGDLVEKKLGIQEKKYKRLLQIFLNFPINFHP